MKKVFSLFMVLLLAISLFACGNKENKEPTVPTPATPEQVIPETPIVPPETSATPPESELSEIEKEMRLIEETAPYYISLRFGDPSGYILRMNNNEDITAKGDVVTLRVEIDYKKAGMTLHTGDEYTQVVADKEYSFDFYFPPEDYTSKEFVKVNLPIHSVTKSDYFCKFYDALSPYLEPGFYRHIIVVLRDGETILGWGEANFEWSESDHQKMTEWIASGEYEY